MTISQLARRVIPKSLKDFIRGRSPAWRVSALLGPFLPAINCVDVGASYYPHVKWLVLLNSPQTNWLAVEPNQANVAYINSWQWPCQVTTCTTGLSREGGQKTLYVTNVDSGSSLLPPEISPSMKHRVVKLNYLFPVRETCIETLTLEQAAKDLTRDAPMFVKLDTQGTELSILQGAQALFESRTIVGIELEATLQAQPIMKGAGKFWQACEFLENNGFELLHVTPIHAPDRSGEVRPGRNTYLNECDAVFALRPDIAAILPVEFRTALLAFYLTNAFYGEALSLLERDSSTCDFLAARGCPVQKLRLALEALA